MTREEAKAYFEECNNAIITISKDENIYDYQKQRTLDVSMRKTYEANAWAISALSAIEKIRTEIKNEIEFWKHPRNPQIDEIRKGHEVNVTCYEHCLESIDRYTEDKDK